MFPDLDRGIIEDVVRAKQGRYVPFVALGAIVSVKTDSWWSELVLQWMRVLP